MDKLKKWHCVGYYCNKFYCIWLKLEQILSVSTPYSSCRFIWKMPLMLLLLVIYWSRVKWKNKALVLFVLEQSETDVVSIIISWGMRKFLLSLFDFCLHTSITHKETSFCALEWNKNVFELIVEFTTVLFINKVPESSRRAFNGGNRGNQNHPRICCLYVFFFVLYCGWCLWSDWHLGPCFLNH